jgi:hypothetical protein
MKASDEKKNGGRLVQADKNYGLKWCPSADLNRKSID